MSQTGYNLTKRNMKKAWLVFVTVLLFTGSPLLAQVDVYVNLGAAIPVGKFAGGEGVNEIALTNADYKEGGAGLGAIVGTKVKFNFGPKGFGVFLSLDGIYNGLNTDVRDDIEDLETYYEQEYGWADRARTPKYINVPLMVGAHYVYNINSSIGIYGGAACGANFRRITRLYVPYVEEYRYYRNKFSFAFQVGAGVEIVRRITVGADFYYLGTERVIGYESSIAYDGSFYGKRITPTLIMFRVGYKF